MRLHTWCLIAAALGGTTFLAGCGHCGSCCGSRPPAPPYVPGTAQPLPPGTIMAGPPNQAAAPAPPVTPGPPPAWPTPAPPPVPQAGGPAIRNYGPVEAPPTWQPAPREDVRLSPPEAAPTQPPATAQLSPPVQPAPEPPRASVEEKPSGEPSKPAPTPPLPVGIPQFAYAIPDRAATGLKPLLDGLDWLQANRFRTVLYVHRPDEPDGADRRLVEKHNMKFLSLSLTPTTLTRDVLDEFNRAVADAANGPVFVYDRDGTLAPALWYLHFRTAGRLSDEDARARAARLGLKTDGSEENKQMWLAVQKFISTNLQ